MNFMSSTNKKVNSVAATENQHEAKTVTLNQVKEPLTADKIENDVILIGRKIKSRRHFISEVARLRDFKAETEGFYSGITIKDDERKEFLTKDPELMKLIIDTTINFFNEKIEAITEEITVFRIG